MDFLMIWDIFLTIAVFICIGIIFLSNSN